MNEHPNHARLHAAGLIDKHEADRNSEAYKNIKNLTPEEIDTLLAIGEKLGGGKKTDFKMLTSF